MSTLDSNTIARLYDFVAGNIISPDKVDDEFNQLVSIINEIVSDLQAVNTDKAETSVTYTKSDLNDTTDGSSGADLIGATGITDLTGTTVQSILESIKAFIDAHKADTNDPHDIQAIQVTYDSSTSSLVATDTKSALDEVAGRLDTNEADIDTLETDKADKSTTYTRTEIDNKDDDLAGTGRTTETIKANYDNIESHKSNNVNPHSVTANQVGAYSKTELQTDGQSQVNWGNLIEVPNLADNSWKPAVAHYNNLPTSGNAVDDMRVVADDGDSKSAIYRCYNAVDGETIANQWEKLADLDFTSDHGQLVGLSDDDHLQYFRVDGLRPMSGNLDMDTNQILNLLLEQRSTDPGVEGVIFYDPNDHEVKVRKATGLDTISGQGAIIRKVTITATDGQTVFDVGQSGTYSYSTGNNTMKVYKVNGDGTLSVVAPNEYEETDGETITFYSGRTAGVDYIFLWDKNLATIADSLEDGTITNNKLATDIKIGSLANLTTTDKSNTVSAINENVGNISTNSTDIGTLQTDVSNIELKTDYITVTQAVDLDTMESDVSTLQNNEPITKTGLTLLQSNWVDNTSTTGYWEYTVTDSDVTTSKLIDIYFDVSNLQNELADVGLGYVTEQSGSYLFQFENQPTGDVGYAIIIHDEVI